VPSYAAIILAGGAARRLGGLDKSMIDVAGRPLLLHVVTAVAGAAEVIVVGPRRPGVDAVTWCQEDPSGRGPVAAIAAALGSVTAGVTLTLAADMPHIAPAVPVLLDALGASDVAMISAAGRLNYLAAAWRTDALRQQLAALATLDGTPARALIDGLDLIEVPDQRGWSTDCDTWPDIEAARIRGKG
jgi:molybdopterin-guanine dinucleotide biosynthesis protein A